MDRERSCIKQFLKSFLSGNSTYRDWKKYQSHEPIKAFLRSIDKNFWQNAWTNTLSNLRIGGEECGHFWVPHTVGTYLIYSSRFWAPWFHSIKAEALPSEWFYTWASFPKAELATSRPPSLHWAPQLSPLFELADHISLVFEDHWIQKRLDSFTRLPNSRKIG